MLTLVAVGLVVAAAAAFRGTWSPCGLSMLSTVTPLAESGRGHRYRWTATWFFLGAVLGGATTGSVAAVAAVGIGALDLSAPTTYAIAGVAAVCAAGLDGRLLGTPIPHHRCQVNEDWLGRYRGWVYGAGFGWQIGTGPGGNNMVEYLRKQQLEKGKVSASRKWLPACSTLADTSQLLTKVLALPGGTYMVDSNRRWTFYDIARAINDRYNFGWQVEACDDFVFDQRMQDERLPAPPLSAHFPLLAKL